MGQRLIDLDDVTHGSIEGPVAEFWWQLDTKDFEQTAHFIFKINTFTEHRLATGQQHSDVMTLHALYMHAAVPAGA